MTDVLRGLGAFPLTPMDAAGVVDTDHLKRLVARLVAHGVDSIGVVGSTGSYMYLSAVERHRAIAAAVEASAGTPVLAGIGDLRTDWVLAHVKAAETAGAHALLLSAVSYLPLTDGDFAALAQTVDQATSLPICLYNNPGTTRFNMNDALVADLSTLSHVAAVKHPAPAEHQSARLAALRTTVPQDFVLGFSGDAFIAPMAAAGADAWYSVIAGTLPGFAKDLWDARHDPDRLAVINERALPMWDLFKRFGGIRIVPTIANMLGLGPIRLPLPLQPLPLKAVAEVERAMDALQGAAG